MNSEQFSSALDGISDDLIDAAAGAYEKKANRKKTVIRVAWAACALLVLTAIGLFWNAPAGTVDPTQPTISIEKPTTAPTTHPETTEPTKQDIIVHTGNVYFLTATEEGAELTPMQANMTMPVDHMFRVRSLKGLSQAAKSKAIDEERRFYREYREKYNEIAGEGWYERSEQDEVIIQYLSGGFASVVLLNNSEIESIEKETTGVLRAGKSFSKYKKEATVGKGNYEVTIPAGSLRLYLTCSMTGETAKIFQENPDTPLSTIRDTITITINYKNGTKEIVVIDITVDDDGHIYMTQHGDNTGV